MSTIIRDTSSEAILAELALEEKLKQQGDFCPYEFLHEKMGKDPRTRPTYGYILTARKRFERKHQCVLEAVDNEGIKWRTVNEVVIDVSARDHGHLRRATRAAIRRQNTALNEADLKPDLRMRLHQNLAQFGALEFFSRSAQQKQIAEAADKSGRLLQAEDVLRHFRDKTGRD